MPTPSPSTNHGGHPDDVVPTPNSGGDLRQLCDDLWVRVRAFLEQEEDEDGSVAGNTHVDSEQPECPHEERIHRAFVKRARAQTKTSLGVIEEALYRYSLDELSLSYNGGKDCLVLLILYLAALSRTRILHRPENSHIDRLQSVYIISPHPFAEVDDFVASSVEAYQLDLARYKKASMREAFQAYIQDHPGIKAIFVGTRRTDPHGEHLTFFDPTDRGWPPFMRVHPVIDWHYAEIWAFIRHLQIPYCQLYDLGYTSLGGTTDTHPNPALRASTSSEMANDSMKATIYRPAYELVEDEEERLGRDR